MKAPRRREQRRARVIESLSTAELLALHEQFFFPLGLETKLRITQWARMNGWDRGWDLDGLAA